MSLLVLVTLRVLEAAKSAGDDEVAHACRRILMSKRFGRRANPDDVRMVLAFT
jgi:hypothetical protein